MRDSVKTKEYFESYLNYEKTQISKREDKLRNCTDEQTKQRILLNLCRNRYNLLVASFSAGADEKTLNDLLLSLTEDFVKRSDISYSSLLAITSLSVFLSNKECAKLVSDRFIDDENCDLLIKGLLSYALNGDAKWDKGQLNYADDYLLLLEAIESESKAFAVVKLCDYLNYWIEINKDLVKAAESDDEIYNGCWCFEAAAVAKAIKANEKKLKCFNFYPVI